MNVLLWRVFPPEDRWRFFPTKARKSEVNEANVLNSTKRVQTGEPDVTCWQMKQQDGISPHDVWPAKIRQNGLPKMNICFLECCTEKMHCVFALNHYKHTKTMTDMTTKITGTWDFLSNRQRYYFIFWIPTLRKSSLWTYGNKDRSFRIFVGLPEVIQR